MRGKPTAHVPKSRLDKPKRDPDFPKPHSSTHRRRRPTHMCGRHLGSKQLHKTHAYAWKSTHMRGKLLSH
ncbi:hypothetical protein PIB30_094690, partial [Stylosanthes scabra]|nr:hypothetical protein [Stylosanthes scabra]